MQILTLDGEVIKLIVRFADAHAFVVNCFLLRNMQIERFVSAYCRRVAAAEAGLHADDVLVIALLDAILGLHGLVEDELPSLLQMPASTAMPTKDLLVNAGVEALALIVEA